MLCIIYLSLDSVLFEVDQTLSTPLHLACQFNQSQCIKELIQPLHNISPLLCSEYISRKNKVIYL